MNVRDLHVTRYEEGWSQSQFIQANLELVMNASNFLHGPKRIRKKRAKAWLKRAFCALLTPEMFTLIARGDPKPNLAGDWFSNMRLYAGGPGRKTFLVEPA